jgi:hypothetical protein
LKSRESRVSGPKYLQSHLLCNIVPERSAV